MGGAVSAVTKPVTSAVAPIIGGGGGIIGGLTGAVAGQMPGYKGTERAIDSNAFKIGNAAWNNAQLQYQADRNVNASHNAFSAQQQALANALAARSQTQANAGNQNQARAAQLAYVQQLQQQAAGKGPSLAMATLKSAQDKSLKQQLAAAASQRGGNQSALQRALLQNQAASNADLGQQAMQGRIAEQLNAQQLLGGATQNLSGTDLAIGNQGLAQQAQDASMYKAAGDIYQGNEAQAGQAINSQIALQNAAQQAAAAEQQMLVNQSLGVQGLNAQGVQSQNAAGAGIIGGLFQGGGAALGARSDKNVKEKIKSYSGSLKEKLNSKSDTDTKLNVQGLSDEKTKDKFEPKKFLDALHAYSFEYKPEFKNVPGAGEGRYLGVMAQDLEKAGPVGRSMVKDTPTGKEVDFGKGLGAMLASQADLNKRLSSIEKGYGNVAEAKRKLKKDK